MTEPRTRPCVAVATRLYAPEASAAAFRIGALVDALAASADVEVLTTRPPAGAVIDPAPTGVTVSRARVLRDRSGALRGYVSYASFDGPLLFRLLARRIDAIVAEAPPTTGLVSLIAAKLRRVPLVYYPGDVWTDGVIAMGAPRPVVSVMRWLETRVLRGAHVILSVSDEVTERLVALGAARERIVPVGNGIDTDVFTPAVEAAKASAPYFVYTGTMSEWQRPEIFVEALAALGRDDVEVRFFGQGTAESAVRAAADRLAPGRVHVSPVVPPAEAARWIRGAVAALVSIVPGVGYDFARPTKTYAAAAVGTPVLYAGATTGAEVVAGARLGEVAEFTPESVAAGMRRLLEGQAENDALRGERAQWARRTVSLSAAGGRAAAAVLGQLFRTPGDHG